MNKRQTEEIDRFEVGSKDGETFTIVVYQNFDISTSMNGTTSKIPTLKELRTLEGYHVNDKGHDSFQVVELSLIVTKI